MDVTSSYPLAAALAAAGTLLFTAGLAGTIRWRFLDQRIREYVAMESPREPVPPRATVRRTPFRLDQRIHRRLAGTSLAAVVQARLVRAGLNRRASEVILLQVAAALLLAGVGWLLASGAPAVIHLVLVVGLGAAGAAAPLLVLKLLATRRTAAFEQQLPQAIDAMAATLQAGSTLPQAMVILAREMPPPISAEFRRVLREAEVGLSFSDALASMLERVPSGDLTLFTSAISIQQRVGGDLAQIFRGISHTIRERLRIRGEMRVLTAQARYSAYLIAALPVLLFAFLWATSYEYLSGLFQPGITRLLFIGAIVGLVLGFFLMNKIARVEV